MPEGPSIFIMKESTTKFVGRKILSARGNAKIEIERLVGKTVREIKLYGKQTFIVLEDSLAIRIHLLMFGSFSVDEQTKPDERLRLGLEFEDGKLFYYSCSVRLFEGNLAETYDFSADVLSDDFNEKNARKKLKSQPETLVCDALLNQEIFAGVGNIIKNEVLFRIKVHPETKLGNLPPRKLTELIKEARNYSFDFLRWKKEFTLKKHWLVHTKKICPTCGATLVKKHCGVTKRRTFFCAQDQKLYLPNAASMVATPPGAAG